MLYTDGQLHLNLSINVMWSDVNSATRNEVKSGGEWMPRSCEARYRLAIIIPFRDRERHLRILLRHLLPILQRQLVYFRVFVVEQVDLYDDNNTMRYDTLKISCAQRPAETQTYRQRYWVCWVYFNIC